MSMNAEKHKERLIARLKDKEHRDAFVSVHIQIGIPFQIRALREQKGWTQKELADRAGKKQAWIAQIENPNYSGFSLKTLLRIASVFDVGLMVRFAPISALVKWELELSPESLRVQSFEEERYFKPSVTDYVGKTIAKLINPSQTKRSEDWKPGREVRSLQEAMATGVCR